MGDMRNTFSENKDKMDHSQKINSKTFFRRFGAKNICIFLEQNDRLFLPVRLAGAPPPLPLKDGPLPKFVPKRFSDYFRLLFFRRKKIILDLNFFLN